MLSDLDPRLDELQDLELMTRPPVNADTLQLLRAFSDDMHDDGKFFAPQCITSVEFDLPCYVLSAALPLGPGIAEGIDVDMADLNLPSPDSSAAAASPRQPSPAPSAPSATADASPREAAFHGEPSLLPCQG